MVRRTAGRKRAAGLREGDPGLLAQWVPAGPKGEAAPSGPAGTTGLRVVIGDKTVSCNEIEVLVSVVCSAGAPHGVGCPAGTATGLRVRK
jgi:hypothetical protein